MNRAQLKSMGVAARGYGNALFLDEGDEVRADAVVFTPLDRAWTVYATDAEAVPIEATRRSFDIDAEAFDYMYQCLRDKVAARPIAAAEAAAEAAARPRRSLFAAYREMGVIGTMTTIASLATALGWVWISPVTYTRADTRKLYVDSDQRGTYIFPAESGLVVVAVCYSLAVVNMAVQWWLGRRDDGRLARRSLRTAGGTALFSTVALVCMLIRAGEVEDPLYWVPPVLALVSSIVVAGALAASRATDAPPRATAQSSTAD